MSLFQKKKKPACSSKIIRIVLLMVMCIKIVSRKIVRHFPVHSLIHGFSFFYSQKVNESGMEDSSPLPPPIRSLQEKHPRTSRAEAPVDSMLKDMATIIFSTFLLAGWVAFIITYPKVKKKKTTL